MTDNYQKYMAVHRTMDLQISFLTLKPSMCRQSVRIFRFSAEGEPLRTDMVRLSCNYSETMFDDRHSHFIT